MTDELIEAAARAIGQLIEGPAEDMDSNWYGRPLWQSYEREARAAIRVIAPAVITEALDAVTELEIAAQDEGMRDYVNAFRDANQAIRALKEGNSHESL